MGSTKLCGWLGLLFAVSSIVSFIGFSGNVSAATPYDDILKTTDKFQVRRDGCGNGQPRDWSTDYETLFDDDIHWQFGGEGVKRETYRQHYIDSKANGSVIMLQIEEIYDTIRFVYSPDGLELDWDVSRLAVFAKNGGQLYQSDFQLINIGSGCQTSSWQSTQEGASTIGWPGAGGDHLRVFKVLGNNLDTNFPEGYDPSDLDEVFPDTKPNLYPHFSYLVTDKEIKATHDLTQELPELPEPDEGWQNNQWQVMWYLFKCSSIDDDDIIDCPDRESVHSELLERDEIYEWEVGDYGDYLLTAEFRYQSCQRSPSWPETPDYCYLNSEHDEFSFVPGRTVYLPIDGMNITGNTADLNCDVAGNCYDDTRFKDCNVIVAIATLSFDDFNYADCLENISLLANMLSFNTIKFSNSWVSSGNCYTLGTLGNWLNLDNKHVCPYFSNEVRNTVTPFITFLLGLLMIKFIAGKGAHGSREVDI